jgi:hypothetical protein
MRSFKNRQISSMLQVMSRIKGVDRLKNELRKAFYGPDVSQILI